MQPIKHIVYPPKLLKIWQRKIAEPLPNFANPSLRSLTVCLSPSLISLTTPLTLGDLKKRNFFVCFKNLFQALELSFTNTDGNNKQNKTPPNKKIPESMNKPVYFLIPLALVVSRCLAVG